MEGAGGTMLFFFLKQISVANFYGKTFLEKYSFHRKNNQEGVGITLNGENSNIVLFLV
jgi:hypothetical protein